MKVALERERELYDKVIDTFPHAIHSHFIVGRDQIPFGSLVFCNDDVIGSVAAFRRGKDGWVISLLSDGAGGHVLYCQSGHVREWTENRPRRRKRRAN